MLSSAWMRYCLILWTLDVHLCSRSPQGERGLKFERLHQCRCDECVAPRKGSVDWNVSDPSEPMSVTGRSLHGWIEIYERRWLDDRHVTLSAWILTMASTSPFLAEFWFNYCFWWGRVVDEFQCCFTRAWYLSIFSESVVELLGSCRDDFRKECNQTDVYRECCCNVSDK